jgi:membrane-associated phospholipid phosphatase
MYSPWAIESLKKASWLTVFYLTLTVWGAQAWAADALETSGDLLQILLPATAYGMTWLKEDPVGRHSFLTGFATTLGITYGLKLSIHKKRPKGGEMAFPSGHTAAAFGGAAFIARRYGWRLGLPAYIGALLVGHSRIAAEKHDPEDVFAGALVGILPAVAFTPEPLNRFSLRPLLDHNRIGLVWAMRW